MRNDVGGVRNICGEFVVMSGGVCGGCGEG